jgi:hypothetical protein
VRYGRGIRVASEALQPFCHRGVQMTLDSDAPLSAQKRTGRFHRDGSGATAKRTAMSGAERAERSRQRSRITNGSVFLPDCNHNLAWVKRAKDLLREQLQDMGGVDNTSAAERALAKRCAVLITELERREAAFARAGEVSDDALAVYQTSVNTLRRTLEALGLKRRQRDVTPSVADYVKHINSQEEADA